MWPINKIQNFCDHVMEAINNVSRKISFVMFFFLGLVTILASAYVAFFLTSSVIAIPVASAGASLGTFVIAMSLPRFAAIKFDEEKQRLEARIREQVELSDRSEKVMRQECEIAQTKAALKEEHARLQIECERLANQRIGVNSCQRVLKLGLAEYDALITDYVEERFESTSATMLHHAQEKEYIGVLQYRFKALLGIDLTKPRFRDIDGKTIQVSGLHAEYQGKRNDSHEWRFREVRLRTMKDGKATATQVPPEDGLLRELCEKQNAALMKSIDNGSEFASLNSYILGMAREFIRTLLAPLNREVIYLEEDDRDQDADSILTYLEKQNLDIDRKVCRIKERQADIQNLIEERAPIVP